MELKFKLDGIRLKKANELLVNSLINFIRLRERSGHIGEDNPIPSTVLKKVFEESVLKLKFLKPSDKNNPEYLILLKEKYDYIMDKYIRKNDTNLQNKNIFYLPELVYLMGKGYVIVENKKTIQDYKEERSDILAGQQKNLEYRISDAKTYLQQLPSHKTELLGDK